MCHFNELYDTSMRGRGVPEKRGGNYEERAAIIGDGGRQTNRFFRSGRHLTDLEPI